MDEIIVDYGVYTELEVDLTEFDFTGVSKVVFTAKNYPDQTILFEREYTEAILTPLKITPAESRLIKNGAIYDFDIITVDGERYKLGDNGTITLRRGCGQCQE